MKKSVIYCSAILLNFLLVTGSFTACKSTKQAVADKKAEAESEDELAVFPKEFVKDRGIIHLRYKRALGTFGISVYDDENKAYPVLSTGDEFTKSGFSLKAGNKIYKLLTNKQVSSEVANSANGMTIIYTVDCVAKVSVQFEMISTIENADADVLKVTSTIENTGTRNDVFALKAIFDTVLGESAKYHFYDDNNKPVRSELAIRDASKYPYITSKNNNTTAQFLLYGADISPLQMVALANYSTLEKATWEPEMASYRSFDTLMSYNNSGMALVWPDVKLSPEKKASFVFYMTFSTGEMKPSGVAYIKHLDKNLPKTEVQKVEDKDDELAVITENSTEEKNQENLVTVIEDDKNLIDDFTQNVEPASQVKFDVSNLTKEQLSPEYIQKLIDRINALEEDSSSVNRNELLELNAELDAILKNLRQ